MIPELTKEDFARGIRNPYFDRLAKKVEVVVPLDDYDTYEEIAKIRGVKPEDIMFRCLQDFAKILREAE